VPPVRAGAGGDEGDDGEAALEVLLEGLAHPGGGLVVGRVEPDAAAPGLGEAVAGEVLEVGVQAPRRIGAGVEAEAEAAVELAEDGLGRGPALGRGEGSPAGPAV